MRRIRFLTETNVAVKYFFVVVRFVVFYVVLPVVERESVFFIFKEPGHNHGLPMGGILKDDVM